jgi:AAA15 family ATPase/GTPase
MVLEIRLSNFFSIKDEIVLDLRAGNIKTQMARALQKNTFAYKEEQILKSIAVYGANASGKSNIIKAIRFCISLILQSHTYNENTVFDYAPFKFDGYPNKLSSFFIRFIIDKVEYEYSFSLKKSEIVIEELYYYPNGRRAKIFTRNESAGKEKNDIYSFASVIRKPMDVAENTSRKTLYISRASQMDREIPKDIFRFFNEQFVLGLKKLNELFLILNYEKNKEAVIKALQIADSDIVDFRFNSFKGKDFSYDAGDISMDNVQQEQLTISTFHKLNPVITFNFDTEESAGTKLLFYFMMTIFDVIESNKILLIDELDKSLHTKIVEYILNLFHTSKAAQIIYTTHNTNLLDLNKLRKDQIYFVNKKDDASSDLYSLFDYKDFRDTMDVEKAYLQGRFDAIPYIEDSVENLKNIIHE